MYYVIVRDLEDETAEYRTFRLLKDAEVYARKVAEEQYYDAEDDEMQHASLDPVLVCKGVSRFIVNPKPVVDKEVIQ